MKVWNKSGIVTFDQKYDLVKVWRTGQWDITIPYDDTIGAGVCEELKYELPHNLGFTPFVFPVALNLNVGYLPYNSDFGGYIVNGMGNRGLPVLTTNPFTEADDPGQVTTLSLTTDDTNLNAIFRRCNSSLPLEFYETDVRIEYSIMGNVIKDVDYDDIYD